MRLSEKEARRIQKLRIYILAVLMTLCFLILISRLWFLQLAQGDMLQKQSEANRIKLLRSRAPRGTVLDRANKILATSRPQFVVMAIPEIVGENKEALHTLSAILQISPNDLIDIMQKGKERPGSPTRIAVDVPLEIVARIGELRMKMPGVSVDLDHIRDYPYGTSVAHVIGYLGEINKEEMDAAKEKGIDYNLGDYIGKFGLEKQYEQYLRGIDGGKRIEVNAFGRVVKILGDKPYERGKTLKLHIDRDLQIAAQRAFGDRVGALVAIDPRTGAVLCLASCPAFDPNIFAKRVKLSDWNAIAKNKKKPLLNRCLNSYYPPGSTFKPLVAAAALKYGAANEKTSVNCTGSYYFGRTFKDWAVHGHTDFYKAISHSCNVWFYTVGRKLGIDKIAHVCSQFGIGKATYIDLPEEKREKDGTAGIMPSTEWKKKRYGQDWIASETLSCAIGQGYVEASVMQMAIATAAIANKGKVYKPHILYEVQDLDGKPILKIKPELVREVDVEEKHFELVKKAMRKTVVDGTGAGAYRGFDIPVSGKTGTAQNPHGVGHGWFICFAPYDNPTIAIACMVEQGAHGSTSAAPITRAVMDVYFGKKKPNEIEEKSIKAHGD